MLITEQFPLSAFKMFTKGLSESSANRFVYSYFAKRFIIPVLTTYFNVSSR